MKIARRYEELVAWQLCMELSDAIHVATEAGPCLNDREFRDQIRRAATNAAPLIAEGFLRFAPDEFVRYLRMARGELVEVQSYLRFAGTRCYFSADIQGRCEALARHAMGVTTLLLKSKLPLVRTQRKARSRGRSI